MPYFNEPNDFSKNFNKKTPFAKKTDIESVSDSVTRGNVPVIEVKEEEEETYDPGKNAPKPGKIYSPQQEKLEAMKRANPISGLFL